MNCPHCNVTLVMADRCGVEIDYCPQCRGVWLDRGELDKIIERSTQVNSSRPAHDVQVQNHNGSPHEKYFSKHDDHDHHDKHGKHGKKKSWLGDILDF
ncbi:TFIIB-type zinc ribbon-containing protein [Fundidesulfovibrio putealis]|uniref:TFIIB-type zinc ribbon-containing protein n=1 Tax=Fundidesulfovibrio putealis TaxID=270496 RepID=UPI0009FD1DD9|nr:zf-TFIIB domain-containing protein [Fundidesulfovibrio putealis]